MKILQNVLWICIILTQIIFADNTGSKAGAFLRHKMGTVEMGRGGTGAAWDNVSSFSFFYNPALLPQAERRFATVAFQFLPLDRTIYTVGVHFHLPPTGALSFNYIHVGIDNLYAYNSLGERLDEISFGDEIIYASFAQRLHSKLYIGISLKYILENYDASSMGYTYHSKGRGLDLGIYSPITKKIGISFSILNLAGQIKSNTDDLFERGLEIKEYFPVHFIIGSRYNVKRWLKIGMDYHWNNSGKKDFLLGVELSNKDVFLRMGSYDGNLQLGAGFLKQLYQNYILKLDYAFVPGEVGEGTTHMFNWKFIF